MVMVGSMFNATHLRKILTKVKTKSDIVLNDLSDVQKNDLSTSVDKIIKFAKLLDECQGAGFHNCLYRGKNLGSVYTDEQKNAIKSGSFDDLFVGDYWNFSNISYNWEDDDGVQQTSTWSGKMFIADCDYYYGFSAGSTHHLIIIPDSVLFIRRMNSTATTEGAYANSEIRAKPSGLTRARKLFFACFGENTLANISIFLHNKVTDGNPTSGAWIETLGCELMTETQVFNTLIHNSGASTGSVIYDRSNNNHFQFNIFKHAPNLAAGVNTDYWLQDVASDKSFCKCTQWRRCMTANAQADNYVRPFFMLI